MAVTPAPRRARGNRRLIVALVALAVLALVLLFGSGRLATQASTPAPAPSAALESTSGPV